MLDADPQKWDASFRALASEWAGLQHARETIDIEAWDRSMATLRAEHQRLVDEGLWVSGPSDLMTIVGRHRDELAHSNVIAWLLTPTGRHGLGTRLLKALFQAGWTISLFRRAPWSPSSGKWPLESDAPMSSPVSTTSPW